MHYLVQDAAAPAVVHRRNVWTARAAGRLARLLMGVAILLIIGAGTLRRRRPALAEAQTSQEDRAPDGAPLEHYAG